MKSNGRWSGVLLVSLLMFGCGRPDSAPSARPVAEESRVQSATDSNHPPAPHSPTPDDRGELAPASRNPAPDAEPPSEPSPPAIEQPVTPLRQTQSPTEIPDRELLPDGLTPLNPQKTVLLDAARKRLFLKGTVVLREGMLEMFACKVGTKEHESVVAVDSEGYVIHAGLLAVGAEPGRPVQFEPEYRPPQGQVIDIYVHWTDGNGRPYREPAQKWVRHVTRRYYIEPLDSLPDDLTLPEDGELRYDEKRQELIWFGPMTGLERDVLLALSSDATYQSLIRKIYADGQPREMEADFVFAGSGFFEEEDGTRIYLAESGNFICVANFSDAIIDVAVRSLAANEALLFEPYTERIPPLDTEVLVELAPRTESE